MCGSNSLYRLHPNTEPASIPIRVVKLKVGKLNLPTFNRSAELTAKPSNLPTFNL
jgi:hypothetical protein